MKRQNLIQALAKTILQFQPPHPLRVAIDGVDAAGKTRLADEIAEQLQDQPRQIIRASVDGFHNPESIRRSQGELSPLGFYQDSYNYQALIENLLMPLGPEGNRLFRTAVFNYRINQPLPSEPKTCQPDAVLLMDGIFLLRPRLVSFWDLRIFLAADFSETVPRGAARDTALFGSYQAAKERYQKRYVPGQKIYLQEAHPLDKADILIDNNKIEDPVIIKYPKSLRNGHSPLGEGIIE